MEKSGESTAILSKDGRYRYQLTRRWAEGADTALWIMLNPSTATASKDDPTIRRCISFSQSFGMASLMVVNLFAFRATDPKKLLALKPEEAIGPNNAAVLGAAMSIASCVIAAWGALPQKLWTASKPSRDVIQTCKKLQCLGRAKSGAPRHPLYVRSETPLMPWA